MRMRQKLKATSRVLLDNREANIADIADRTARWFFFVVYGQHNFWLPELPFG